MYLHEIYKSFFRILFTPLWNCACFEFPGTEAISHYRVPFAKKIGLITIRKHQGIFILCSQASQINNGLKTFIKSYFHLYIYFFMKWFLHDFGPNIYVEKEMIFDELCSIAFANHRELYINKNWSLTNFWSFKLF